MDLLCKFLDDYNKYLPSKLVSEAAQPSGLPNFIRQDLLHLNCSDDMVIQQITLRLCEMSGQNMMSNGT
jgi:hypothetical protein